MIDDKTVRGLLERALPDAERWFAEEIAERLVLRKHLTVVTAPPEAVAVDDGSDPELRKPPWATDATLAVEVSRPRPVWTLTVDCQVTEEHLQERSRAELEEKLRSAARRLAAAEERLVLEGQGQVAGLWGSIPQAAPDVAARRLKVARAVDELEKEHAKGKITLLEPEGGPRLIGTPSGIDAVERLATLPGPMVLASPLQGVTLHVARAAHLVVRESPILSARAVVSFVVRGAPPARKLSP